MHEHELKYESLSVAEDVSDETEDFQDYKDYHQLLALTSINET